MKKFFLRESGFTLVELLVVVVIISILAVIGFAVIGGSTSKARDARRRADIDSLVKAHETTFDAGPGNYRALVDPDFTSGKLPKPPEGGTYYDNTPSAGAKTYTVCAVLDAAPANTTCTATSDICYCRSAAQATTGAATQAATCTKFKGGSATSQTCGNGSTLSGTKYLKCSDIPSGMNLDCSTSCNYATSGTNQLYSIYNDNAGTQVAASNVSLTTTPCGWSTVTLNVI